MIPCDARCCVLSEVSAQDAKNGILGDEAVSRTSRIEQTEQTTAQEDSRMNRTIDQDEYIGAAERSGQQIK